MIVEKPKCPYCNGVCGSNNPDAVYLKKIDDGWICPECKCEYYDKPEPILTYWSYPYPLPEILYPDTFTGYLKYGWHSNHETGAMEYGLYQNPIF